MKSKPYIVGKMHTDQWIATLTNKGWEVEGDYWGTDIIKSDLDMRFGYSTNPAWGQPGVRSLRLAAKYYKARMELLTEIDPQDDPAARY